MRSESAPAKRQNLLRNAVVKLDDAKLRQLIVELNFNTKLEQAVLHFARNEQCRRDRQAKKAAKAAQ